VAGFIQARDVNQEKKMPLTEWGVGRGTGRPWEKRKPEKKGAVSEKREGGTHSGGFAVALLWGGGVQETQKK